MTNPPILARHGRSTPSSALTKITISLLAFLGMSSTALAADLSLPYRNYPGFVCHSWNSRGECADFSYSNTPTPNTPYQNTMYGPTYQQGQYYSKKKPLYPSSYSNSSYYYQSTYYPYAQNYYDPGYDPYGQNYYNGYTSSYYPGYNGYQNGYYPPYGNNVRPISVAVSSPNTEVQPDDTITYRIYIRNDSPIQQRIPVRAYFDGRLAAYDTSSNGGRRLNNDQVDWSITLNPWTSHTLALRLRINRNARDGDRMTVRVDADGDSDSTITEITDSFGYNNDNCYRSGRDSRYYSSGYYYGYDHCDDYYYHSSSSYYDPYYNDNYYNDDYYDDYRSSNRDVSLRLYTSDTSPTRGQVVNFTIQLENDGNSDRTVDVRASFDRGDWDFYSASDSGRLRSGDDEVNWDNILVRRGDRRTLSFSMRVDTNARDGDQLRVSADDGDDSDSETITVRY